MTLASGSFQSSFLSFESAKIMTGKDFVQARGHNPWVRFVISVARVARALACSIGFSRCPARRLKPAQQTKVRATQSMLRGGEWTQWLDLYPAHFRLVMLHDCESTSRLTAPGGRGSVGGLA
jgi:hypothetical protein